MPPPPAAAQAGYTGGYQPYQPYAPNRWGGPALAEPGMRLLARFLDCIVVLLLGCVIGLIFGAGAFTTGFRGGAFDDGSSGFGGNEFTQLSNGTAALIGIVGFVLIIAYEVLMVGTMGQTLGKLAAGVKVVRRDGSSMTVGAAARRHLPSIVLRAIGAIPVLALSLVGGLGLVILAIVNIVMVFSSKASLYDKVGDTMVITTR